MKRKNLYHLSALLLLLSLLLPACGGIDLATPMWPQKTEDDAQVNDGEDESVQSQEDSGPNGGAGASNESGAPAQSAAGTMLQNYLNDVLIPQYGRADLTARKMDIGPANYEEIYAQSEQYKDWTKLDGISDAKICDIDGDGVDELTVAFVKEQNAGVSVYEAERGSVVKRSEILEEYPGDLCGYDIIWAMVEAGGKSYLLWGQADWGVLADYYSKNVRLWRYDGRKMGLALEILQTDGGSSNFEYTAYQYGESGQLASEEVIYRDFAYDRDVAYPEEYRMARLRELLGSYGIQEGDNAFQYAANVSLEPPAAADGKCQPLLDIHMDGKYEDGNIIFYFNN